MASNATVPTTVMVIESSRDVFADDRREVALDLGRNERGIGDDRVPQRAGTRAVAVARGDARDGGADDPLRHGRIGAQIAEDLLHADVGGRLMPAVVVGD